MQTTQVLVELGADTEAENASGARPLHYAAGRGRLAVVTLLELGASVEARDADEDTCLHWAARLRAKWGRCKCWWRRAHTRRRRPAVA